MYPVYALEVYSFSERQWVRAAGVEASSRPHHYDTLRKEYERLVSGAIGGSPSQQPIGYRIVARDVVVYDCWTNGKVPV